VKATVVIVAHAGVTHLEDSLESLAPTSQRRDVEVVVVDNGSADRCGEVARKRWPWVRVIRCEHNLGFAGGVNLGAESAEGEVLVLLNDDAAAGDGFVDAHLEVLAGHPEVAATAGRLTTWDGRRHDFVRGGVTFDGHAFQIAQGWPVSETEAPTPGEAMPFACGGNMSVRRSVWEEVGGFDPDLFAYFEDVELGWRLWAFGHRVVAAPEAVARHRGGATSSGLGDFRRGVLFERNALRTFFACADDDYRSAFGPVVYATFLHRLRASTRATHIGTVAADPFSNGGAPSGRVERWRRRLADRGVVATVRHLIARVLLGPEVGAPTLSDGHFLMQLRAADGFFAGLSATEERRLAIARRRTVSDREITARFPRMVVPTYPGDREWFASQAFRAMLPRDWPLDHRRLDDVLHPSVLG
jgi:GT2 family glycosyltransferase